jgi:AraC-like DNA-binding protein
LPAANQAHAVATYRPNTPHAPRVVADVGCAHAASLIRATLHEGEVAHLDLARDLGTSLCLYDAAVIVLGSRLSDGASSTLTVRHLRERLPHVSITVCATSVGRYSEGPPALAAAGADGWFRADRDADLHQLVAFVSRRVRAPVPELEVRDLHARLRHGLGRLIALYCLRNSHRQWRVGEVASAFAMDPKTVNRLVRQAGAPPAGVLLRLGRLLHARELRRRTNLSQEEIARRLGFGSASALGMLRHRLVKSPTQAALLAARRVLE